MKYRATLLIIIVACIVLVGCGQESPPPNINKSEAVWLNLEDVEDFYDASKDVKMGKVVLSPSLKKALRKQSSDTVLAVAICFTPMVSESDTAGLTFWEELDYLNDVFEKASRCCTDAGMLVEFPFGTGTDYTFFYAYGTKNQIKKLKCDKNVALYIAASYQCK